MSSKTHQRVRAVPVTIKPQRPISEEVKATATPPAEDIPLAVAMPLDGAETEEVLVEGVGTVAEPIRTAADAQDEMSLGTPIQGSVVDTDEDEADLSLLETTTEPAKDKTSTGDESHTGFVEIFRPECMQCKALVPSMKKLYKECHYSKGNKYCPAREVQIVVRIPLNEILPRWLRYEREGDYAGISRMAAKLSEKPDYYQQRVKDALADARKEGRFS